MDNEKNIQPNKNKIIIISCCVIVLVVSILLVTLLLNINAHNDKIRDDQNGETNNQINNGTSNSNDENNNEIDNSTNENINNQDQAPSLDEYIMLDGENHKFQNEKLEMNFIGVKVEDKDGFYKYTLEIFINNNKIDSYIFGKKDNMLIWSNSYAADFRVLKLDKYYIFISSIAKLVDGKYILIIDEDGKFVKSFEDVQIIIDKENLEFEITDCQTTDVSQTCPTTNYKIIDLESQSN